MLLVSIIFGTLISISTTNGLRVCDDCIFVRQCPQAMHLMANDRSEITVAKIRNAVCGFRKEIKVLSKKICCSDLLESEVKNAEDEIENHPNIQLLPNGCGQIPARRLLGGNLYSHYEFPWVVLIASRGSRYVKFDCQGTLINSRYVLTTAHCIEHKHIFGVRVVDFLNTDCRCKMNTECFERGDIPKCKPKYQDIGVADTVVHEGYSLHSIPVNNIGLLRLSRPVNFPDDTNGVVCLPVFQNLLNTNLYGDRGAVAGWNMEGDELIANTLLTSTIPIQDRNTCRSYFDRYQKYHSTGQVEQILCAGKFASEACIRGEGIPLMLEGEYNNTNKYVQYGIQSHGPAMCGSNIPEIYTDIRKHMKWILDYIKP